MRAVVVHEPGGPEVLRLEEVADPEPKRDHDLVTVKYAGVNFADVRMREDNYVAPVSFPFIPGRELVGTTQDGRRIAALTDSGAYAEKALVQRGLAWEIPDEISDEQACALLLAGQSAWHLLHTSLAIQEGETVLIPAAAGSLGSLAVQLAKRHGVKVIAMARGPMAVATARSYGPDAVLDTSDADDLAERIMDAAGGRVDAALEMMGGKMLAATVEALTPRGRMALFGCTPGHGIPQGSLIYGSKTISGFWLPDYYSNRYALRNSMNALFSITAIGALKTPDTCTYPMENESFVRDAHEAIALGLSGKALLEPAGLYDRAAVWGWHG
ncbi:quinone oxidoreductase family protein [Streptomyces olivoreticuli]|uniref:quinone oxidoreductase family protein n=1 Tax=Streptomyces olivoreticuli TaxID=68246 RepID=UPI0013C2C5B4|nr:zinc-binding dehydrogenase [Streptomyces olivoreticuli]